MFIGHRVHRHSGFGASVSTVDWDELPRKIDDAIVFLKTNADELRKLIDFPGIEEHTLDFPVWQRHAAVECDRFSAKSLKLAGNLAINIEILRYA